MENIKVIFIDWNGTLSRSLFFEQMNNDKHPYHHLLPSIEEWLFRKNKKLCSEWMYGKYTSESIIEMMSKDLQIDYDLLLTELRTSCENMKLISNEIPSLIKKIKEHGIRVVIATDNMDCFTKWTVPALGLERLFDEILNSFDLGIVKNDFSPEGKPLFFEQFMNKYKLDYSNTLLLDDSSKTCNLLRSAGMQCITIDSNETMINTLKEFVN